MKLEIFDVEHGACSLLTTDDNTRLMIDCGHNATTAWMPGTYLTDNGITKLDMLAITNYDKDHASGAENLFDKIDVRWLWRNKSVSGKILKELKRDTGMGNGIERLVHEMENTFTGNGTSPRPTFAGLDKRMEFRNKYPLFNDENNLSLVIYLECHGIGVLYTGDVEKAGFTELLKDEKFRNILQSTRVYVAPHHGRDGACSDEVAGFLTNVSYVVISDSGYEYDTQKTIPFYEKIANGGPFRGRQRMVLTTRNDGTINFSFRADGWGPY